MDLRKESCHLDDKMSDYVAELSDSYGARRKFVVEVSHGLGNRLRSLLTAATVAIKSNRQLVIVWKKDVHLGASLDDLFHLDGAEWYEESFMECAKRSAEYKVYDYLKHPADERDRPLVNALRLSDLYVHTAYRVLSTLPSSQVEFELVLDALRPKSEVDDFLRRMKQQLWRDKRVSVRDALGVHIGMRSVLEGRPRGTFP